MRLEYKYALKFMNDDEPVLCHETVPYNNGNRNLKLSLLIDGNSLS